MKATQSTLTSLKVLAEVRTSPRRSSNAQALLLLISSSLLPPHPSRPRQAVEFSSRDLLLGQSLCRILSCFLFFFAFCIMHILAPRVNGWLAGWLRVLVARAENSSLTKGCGFLCSGKTSLLLQFAYNCARQDSSSFVTFLCKPHSLDDNPPCLSQVRFRLLLNRNGNTKACRIYGSVVEEPTIYLL